MDQTPTPNGSSFISTLMDTPQPSSPTVAQQVNIPITGTSNTVQSENPQQGLPLVIILSVLMMGMIGIGGLVFGNLSFLGISHLD